MDKKKKQRKIFVDNVAIPLAISVLAFIVAFFLNHFLYSTEVVEQNLVGGFFVSVIAFFMVFNVQFILKILMNLDHEEADQKFKQLNESIVKTEAVIQSVQDDVGVLKNSPEMEEHVKQIEAQLSELNRSNHAIMQQVTKVIESTSLEDRISSLKKSIDQKYPLVFDAYFEPFWTNVRLADREKKVEIKDTSPFKSFYIKILESVEHPSTTTFYATSLFSRNYFWEGNIKKDSVEDATRTFTAKGGKFKRIFFYWEDDDFEVIQTVNAIQEEMGVDTFIVDINNVKSKILYILVSDDMEIAWEVIINPSNRKIVQANLHTNRDNNKFFYKTFNEYMRIAQPLREFIDQRKD